MSDETYPNKLPTSSLNALNSSSTFNNLPILKKRSSTRKKKIGKSNKFFDLKIFKDKIMNDLFKSSSTSSQPKSLINDYETKFKHYIQEGLTNNILNFINRMILDSKSLTDDIKNSFPIHKHVFNVVKTLFLNEIEIVYFSTYLERFSWHTDGFSFEDNLFIIGLVAKVI